MSIVTKLPNVSAQSRAFISGRSKRTWHGDLYTQTGAGGNGRKNVGGKSGCVCCTKPMWSLGLKIINNCYVLRSFHFSHLPSSNCYCHLHLLRWSKHCHSGFSSEVSDTEGHWACLVVADTGVHVVSSEDDNMSVDNAHVQCPHLSPWESHLHGTDDVRCAVISGILIFLLGLCMVCQLCD